MKPQLKLEKEFKLDLDTLNELFPTSNLSWCLHGDIYICIITYIGFKRVLDTLESK